ncbi:MAG: hypothetical protein QOE10_2638 [Gaiellales bacterium]|jgi:hypothetical protein|nr:hypothetical protein [Gaiellales bacterium]
MATRNRSLLHGRRSARTTPDTGLTPSRLEAARRRAAAAKLAIGSGGIVAFGFAMLLAHGSYAGHARHGLKALSAPARFVAVVQQDQLQAGILAPASAPPGAATSVS